MVADYWAKMGPICQVYMTYRLRSPRTSWGRMGVEGQGGREGTLVRPRTGNSCVLLRSV